MLAIALVQQIPEWRTHTVGSLPSGGSWPRKADSTYVPLVGDEEA